MSKPQASSREDVLATIAAAFEQAAPDGGGHDFIGRYYRHVPFDELTSRAPEVYAGAARSHLELARDRLPGVANVRVYNPTTETDGWSNARTIIQIVTDDMPFLVDSVTGALVGAGIDIHLIVHPQLVVSRDAVGHLEEVVARDVTGRGTKAAVGELAESWMLLSVDRESDEGRRAELEASVRHVLEDVRQAVEDWPKMRSKCLVLAAEMEGTPPAGVDADEVARATTFLRWMAEDHFTFLGYRDYALDQTPEGEVLAPVDRLRARPPPLRPAAGRAARRPVARGLGQGARAEHPRADQGELALHRPPGHPPRLRRHQAVLRRPARSWASGASSASTPPPRTPSRCCGSRSSPRRCGPSSSAPASPPTATPARTSSRSSRATRATSCSRRASRTSTRRRWRSPSSRSAAAPSCSSARTTSAASCPASSTSRATATTPRSGCGWPTSSPRPSAASRVEFTARVSESALSRLQFVVRVPRGKRVRTLDRAETEQLEQRLVEVSRTWADRLGDALRAEHGEEGGDRLHGPVRPGLPDGLRGDLLGQPGRRRPPAPRPPRPRPGHERRALPGRRRRAENTRRFKLFRVDPLSLTDILPIFTHMGVEVVDEQPYEVERADGTTAARLRLRAAGLERLGVGRLLARPAARPLRGRRRRRLGRPRRVRRLQQARPRGPARRGARSSSCGPSRSTCGRPAPRTRRTTSRTRSSRNPAIARDLVALFESRFAPADAGGAKDDGARTAAEEEVAQRILDALDDVSLARPRPDHPGLPRRGPGRPADELLPAGQRRRGAQAVRLASSSTPRRCPTCPAPRPQFEIWVYSPRVEGVHLRFGPVARGGLRWSRPARGLPHRGARAGQGADGQERRHRADRRPRAGSTPSSCPTRRSTARRGSRRARPPTGSSSPACSTSPTTASSGRSSRRERVVRHDGDDPYLVVAADKGTATFSDIANGVAQSYGFWLDDAFASGGSAGYDHKAMGITARGAWESVKRHFREMGVDTQTEDFTVVGVGDMSGDVFGNGMLLSEHIRLVAAFDHRHVFVDPNPDAAASFAERERLFELPRSSWDDYDRSLISDGRRRLPAVAEVDPGHAADGRRRSGCPRARRHDDAGRADPRDPPRAGRPALERRHRHLRQGLHRGPPAQIGDRANDAIRVDGKQLRVKVVGEGGNLGLLAARPHRGRAQRGAGQHRRHRQLRRRRHLRPRGQHQDPRSPRSSARATSPSSSATSCSPSMTDDVAAHVLRDNYEQNVLLGNARAQEHSMVPRAPAAHPLARGARRARPRAGVPALRRRDREARARQAWA